MKMVKLTGGGIQGNKVTQSRAGYKVEPVAKAASPAGVNQTGVRAQFRKEPIMSGPGYTPKPVPATGIPGSYNAATQGPASQRTVYASGSQSTYGPVNPGVRDRAPDVPGAKPGRDILSDYGPEASGKGR